MPPSKGTALAERCAQIRVESSIPWSQWEPPATWQHCRNLHVSNGVLIRGSLLSDPGQDGSPHSFMLSWKEEPSEAAGNPCPRGIFSHGQISRRSQDPFQAEGAVQCPAKAGHLQLVCLVCHECHDPTHDMEVSSMSSGTFPHHFSVKRRVRPARSLQQLQGCIGSCSNGVCGALGDSDSRFTLWLCNAAHGLCQGHGAKPGQCKCLVRKVCRACYACCLSETQLCGCVTGSMFLCLAAPLRLGFRRA